MTEDELREIEERANAATAGPWVQSGETWDGDATGGVWVRLNGGSTDDVYDGVAFVSRWEDRGKPDHAQSQDFQDAAFIAHARADVPTLVAEIRRLKALLDDNFGGK